MFCEIAPQVVAQIYRTKNIVCYGDANTRIDGGRVLPTEVLPTEAVLAMWTIRETQVDASNEKHVSLALFGVFVNVLASREISGLDAWMRANFDIEVPPD
jgi:hypothetical protein